MNMGPALDSFLNAWMDAMHTALPARVSSYDMNTHRAKVTPAIRHLMDNGMQIELPELVDVPVVFPSAKAFDLEFPLDKDDPVLLVFLEADTASWKSGAVPAAPDTASRFSLDSAVAIPGLSPKPVQGRARITIDQDGTVTWSAKKFVFSGQAVFKDAVIARDDVYVGPEPTGPGVSLKNHIHQTGAGPSTPPDPPTPIPPEVK